MSTFMNRYMFGKCLKTSILKSSDKTSLESTNLELQILTVTQWPIGYFPAVSLSHHLFCSPSSCQVGMYQKTKNPLQEQHRPNPQGCLCGEVGEALSHLELGSGFLRQWCLGLEGRVCPAGANTWKSLESVSLQDPLWASPATPKLPLLLAPSL